MSATKPKIRASSVRWLVAVDRYVREYNIRGDIQQLRSAASDVLDSHATRKELDDLIRRRLLTVIPTGERDWRGNYLCGTTWTVDLTDRAIDAFWPSRRRKRSAQSSHPAAPANSAATAPTDTAKR